jgi:gluconate kinase
VKWIFLVGECQEIAERIQRRSQTTRHYMPASLLRSQFESLEPPTQAFRVHVNIPTDEQLALIRRALLQ